MSAEDENYEEFVKRYRAGKGQPAEGPRFSPVNKHLALTIVGGVAFYLFTSAITSNLDEAIAEQEVRENQDRYGESGRNPWSKD